MHIEHFFDEHTSTLTYVVHDGSAAVVIDPVRDYEPKSGHTWWGSAEKVATYFDRERLALPYAIDTHAHRDHLTALPFFRQRHGARTATGAPVGEVGARSAPAARSRGPEAGGCRL